MTIPNILAGGLAGASTLSLLHEAMNQFDNNSTPLKSIGKPGMLRKLAKYKKKGKVPEGFSIKLAGELLSGAAYYGLTGLSKKKNAVMTGSLLGLAAGLVSVMLQSEGDELEQQTTAEQLATVAGYTAAGALTGYAVKKWGKKRSKKSRKKK